MDGDVLWHAWHVANWGQEAHSEFGTRRERHKMGPNLLLSEQWLTDGQSSGQWMLKWCGDIPQIIIRNITERRISELFMTYDALCQVFRGWLYVDIMIAGYRGPGIEVRLTNSDQTLHKVTKVGLHGAGRWQTDTGKCTRVINDSK